MCLPTAGQNAWSEADCVTLLDSTSVTVQPNGSGSFAVYKSFKVQTPKGAVNNHVIKYDYDPLTAFARFKQVTVQRANGETIQVDVTKTCDYAAPAADFEGSLQQVGNKLVLKQKLALKKRIYRAADWEGFRAAVNAYKSFADYLIVKL